MTRRYRHAISVPKYGQGLYKYRKEVDKMVRSMVAGVAGLKAHQNKMDVIGNNIANVNTWGFKGYSYNFKDGMYTNSIKSSAGSVLAGAAGGGNASQVGYGSQLSSISNVFEPGAPSPSANPMDCMIDGTGFFLVGNMVNGSFDNVGDSGLYLSRVGIFRVDENGYLVDDQRSYVYGYAVDEGTGIPETPATAASVTLNGVPITKFTPPAPNANDPSKTDNARITIAGIEVRLSGDIKSVNQMEDAIQEWVTYVTNSKNRAKAAADEYGDKVPAEYANVKIDFMQVGRTKWADGATAGATDGGDGYDWTAQLKITSTTPGENSMKDVDAVRSLGATGGIGGTPDEKLTVQGTTWEPGISAIYSDQLSTIKIPNDPKTGMPFDLRSYSISADGTITGVDDQERAIVIGKLALISVQNPNGLEKVDGYYYRIGDNAGDVGHEQPNTSPTGSIMGSYLEMANVDLANEFSNIITTQRGFQANSKIITVTDEMLQELVNLKR